MRPIRTGRLREGYQSKREPRKNEVSICVGNGMRVVVKAVGVVRLDLGQGRFFDLENVYCVPSMKRNLVSVSCLVKKRFSFFIDFEGIKISHGSQFIGSACFVNDYWMLSCTYPREIYMIENSETLTGNKRKYRDNSAFLWHRRLGHISKERLHLLVKQEILPALDFSDLIHCIECIKGKFVKQKKKTATRSIALLQLIHTEICGPFATQTICGNKYFITFTDDFSRYCYIYLISDKSQALEKFKIYKAEVEKELNTEIKVVRSDRGGEFFGRYTESGQNKGPFALYLQENGIQAQYTTPGTPEQNGVVERRNRTFLNMVRSLMCTSGLPKFLWGEALKTANYLTNRTPSKSVSLTPFQIWKNRKPSISHTHVWGCKAKARPYNPQENKLDSKTISAFFIGYPDHSKGYKFYCPTHSTRIIETNKAVFMDEINYSHNLEDL